MKPNPQALSCLAENSSLQAKAQEKYEAARARDTDPKHKESRYGYWRGTSAVNITNDPIIYEKYGGNANALVAGYTAVQLQLFIQSNSSILAFAQMREATNRELYRFWWTRRMAIKVWVGGPQGGAPSLHDVDPTVQYVDILPRNFWTEEIRFPTDIVELGQILTSEYYDTIIQQARDELDIQIRQQCWLLLNTSALAGFGTQPVFQPHPSIATTRLITGNDYDWSAAGNAFPLNPAAVRNNTFTLDMFKEIVALTGGMLGNDGKPLPVRRLIVPNRDVRADIMNWPGSASTAGGVPEGILEQIWRGTWLFRPSQMEGGGAMPSDVIIEEDATIGDDYLYVFTNLPAFEFVTWPDRYREWKRDPDFRDPDTHAIKIKTSFREYEPSPYLGRWLRIKWR